MPAKIYQILFESKTFWPLAVWPDRFAVLNTGHNSVVVFDHVIDSQHPQPKLLGLKLFWNYEVG
ncbi:hypothetical protein IQ256_26235 [cf. Phormidesmis sp. LEGE 11477]|nr:hypothetical protein [cf. Phormidesmis sp. LEGE 11477]